MIAFDPQRWVSQETVLAEKMLRSGPGWWDEAEHHVAGLVRVEPDLFKPLQDRVKKYLDARRKVKA